MPLDNNYDATFYTLQHRYLDYDPAQPGGVIVDPEGWCWSNYDNIAAPALKAGHDWLMNTPLHVNDKGAQTLQDGLRGLAAVRVFHAEHQPVDPHTLAYGQNLCYPWSCMAHKPVEFRLVKVRKTRTVEPVPDDRAAGADTPGL